MSVLRIKNEITGEWQNVPFISSGGSSAPSEFGTIIEGDNIEVKKVGDDVKISAIVPTLISQLQNDLGYQTLTDVMGVIASIPKFKLSIVNDLPETGERMTLYLVPKVETRYDGTKYDAFGEYIWIEQTASYEYLGTTAPDLTDYVKTTDYASVNKHGIVKFENSFGVTADNNGRPFINRATNAEIDAKKSTYKPIVPSNLNYAVNSVLPTMTQAEYDAIETKDENLFYMIVEE